MSSQLIFLVALVAGCFANSIVKANEASVDVPNLWKLEVDVENITGTEDLLSKRVISLQGKSFLELEYGRLSRIYCVPIGNNEVIDRNVTRDFDILLRVPIFPKFETVIEEEEVVNNGNLNEVSHDYIRRLNNDIIFNYTRGNIDRSQVPLWEMDFNKKWMYEFDGPVYELTFSIRKVEL